MWLLSPALTLNLVLDPLHFPLMWTILGFFHSSAKLQTHKIAEVGRDLPPNRPNSEQGIWSAPRIKTSPPLLQCLVKHSKKMLWGFFFSCLMFLCLFWPSLRDIWSLLSSYVFLWKTMAVKGQEFKLVPSGWEMLISELHQWTGWSV